MLRCFFPCKVNKKSSFTFNVLKQTKNVDNDNNNNNKDDNGNNNEKCARVNVFHVGGLKNN